MTIILSEAALVVRARCHVLGAASDRPQPTSRIVRSQFDVLSGAEAFGEYVLMNLVQERGLLHDGKLYRITIEPLFPHEASPPAHRLPPE